MDEETQEWDMDWILFSFEPAQKIHKKLLREIKGQKSEISRLGICPMCQKYIGRGLFMHQKYCEG